MIDFIPIYYEDELVIVNPEGDVGLVTFWSPPRVSLKRFQESGVDMSSTHSRVAVAGTLYGEGLPHMLRNLLYNPQIRFLALFGDLVDEGVSKDSLIGFFRSGLKETTELGASYFQIAGTETIIDGGVLPEDFGGQLTLFDLGTPKDAESVFRIKAFFDQLPPKKESDRPRREVKIPEVDVQRLPSDPRAHNIVSNTPMEAWKELVHRLLHFGHENVLKKGSRIELQNVKVTINQPVEEPESVVKACGFSLKQFKTYQEKILSSDLPSGTTYSYGHRLRKYFGREAGAHPHDTLLRVVDMLNADPESRKAYISLWDTSRDLLFDEQGHPCLISLYFRKFEEKLTMTAVFRTHNALKAWPENVYGLIAIQRFVAEKVRMESGPITLMSYSISIDPAGGTGKARAKTISDFRNDALERNVDAIEEDPHGYFQISVDNVNLKIVVKHQFKGIPLHTYTGDGAVEVERRIVADNAVSNIAHALYLGRELARAEARLETLKRKKKAR